MADLWPDIQIRVPQRFIPGFPASASANVFQISVKQKHFFFDPEVKKNFKKEITTLVFIYRMVISFQRFLLSLIFSFSFSQVGISCNSFF